MKEELQTQNNYLTNKNLQQKQKREIKSKKKKQQKDTSRKGDVRGDQYKPYAHYSGVESVNNKKPFKSKNLQCNESV